MKVSVSVIGKLKDGPERELVDRYLKRAQNAGKQLGLSGFTVQEFPESRQAQPMARKKEEADVLLRSIGTKAILVLLDERGSNFTSKKFAERITRFQESSIAELIFIIGGADGLDRKLHEKASEVIAFSALTWPHQITRILLAEQLYRAVTILTGHPYHRT